MVEDRETIQPIVLINHNDIVGMVWTSHKTAQKSLETGVLWEIHSQTKREIEVHPRIPIGALHKKKGWYIAEVDEVCYDDILEKPLHSLAVSPICSEPICFESAKGETHDIFSQLQSMIMSRKTTLPEGSYTTHLFQSGTEKIRKKLGEEAIELVLSADKESIISESADLLYHLLVLLVDENIDMALVLQELMQRHAKVKL